MEIRVLSVNVGQPKAMVDRNGEPTVSAIDKQPVSTSEIEVRATDLVGDRQADPTVHGGVDKAVYAYSANHWPWWLTERQLDCHPGTFGENLTVAGAVETQVRIGDRFQWGEALLEISQPRQPCFKLNAHTDRDDTAAVLMMSGRSGWYFRVIEPGIAPTTAPLVLVQQSDGPTVRETMTAAFDRNTDPVRRKEIADDPALSSAWRATLLRRS